MNQKIPAILPWVSISMKWSFQYSNFLQVYSIWQTTGVQSGSITMQRSEVYSKTSWPLWEAWVVQFFFYLVHYLWCFNQPLCPGKVMWIMNGGTDLRMRINIDLWPLMETWHQEKIHYTDDSTYRQFLKIHLKSIINATLVWQLTSLS